MYKVEEVTARGLNSGTGPAYGFYRWVGVVLLAKAFKLEGVQNLINSSSPVSLQGTIINN